MTTIPNPIPTGAGEVPVAKHDQDAEVERHRADPQRGAVAPPPIGNAAAFGFGLPSTKGERSAQR
jgi:hypothetical protein